MSIIPVLDLMIGQVVLAEGGNRDAYRPVHSRLTTSSQPLDVAEAIFHQTGCDWLYLADIDSFAGAPPNWSVYQKLLERGFGLWVDSDWLKDDQSQQIAEQLGKTDRFKPIVSSETLLELDQMAAIRELQGAGWDVIFSVDQTGDQLITRSPAIGQLTPRELIHRCFESGVRELIVLDLQEVGTRRGFDDCRSAPTLIGEVRQELPEMKLTSGGGVRTADDIARWLSVGCDHVLVATAIHDCVLTPDDVTRLRHIPDLPA
jgi:phosphoribosylformimino-5-aminoimidazole carboxamide ribotide isomerase